MRNGFAIASFWVSLLIISNYALAKDINLNKQVRDGKGATAYGGISLVEKGKVSFDSTGNVATKTAGFWMGLPDKLYTVLFRDNKTGDSAVIVEFQGTIRWNEDGKITAAV